MCSRNTLHATQNWVKEWGANKDAGWFGMLSTVAVALGLVAWHGIVSHGCAAAPATRPGRCFVWAHGGAALHHELRRLPRLRRSPPLPGTRYLHQADGRQMSQLKKAASPCRPSRAGAVKAHAVLGSGQAGSGQAACTAGPGRELTGVHRCGAQPNGRPQDVVCRPGGARGA